MILAINILLVIWSIICLLTAGIHLYRRKPRPAIATITAVLSVFFFALCITAWNSVIPVWVWWIILSGVGLLVGYASIQMLPAGKTAIAHEYAQN